MIDHISAPSAPVIDLKPVRRALLSVTDKTGLVDFARALTTQATINATTGNLNITTIGADNNLAVYSRLTTQNTMTLVSTGFISEASTASSEGSALAKTVAYSNAIGASSA